MFTYRKAKPVANIPDFGQGRQEVDNIKILKRWQLVSKLVARLKSCRRDSKELIGQLA